MSHAKGAAATRAGRAPGTAGHGRGMTTQAAMLGAGGLQQATLLVTAEATTAAALAGKGQQGQQKGSWVWVPQAPAEPELPPRKWPKEGRYDRRSAKAKAIREMKGVLRRRQASEGQPDASAASGAEGGEVQAVSAAQAEQPAAPCCKSSSSSSESGTSEPDCEPPSGASSVMEDIAGRSVCQQKAGSSAASAADSSAAAAAGSSAAAASSAAAGSSKAAGSSAAVGAFAVAAPRPPLSPTSPAPTSPVKSEDSDS